MEFKQQMYVDENKNIVTEIKMIMTPEEFLQRNSAVFQFAESMRPGQMLGASQKITHKETA